MERSIKPTETDQVIRGFLFACTKKTEAECLERRLFAADRSYGPVVIRVRKGDVLFLNNLDTDTVHGVFEALCDGRFNIEPGAFGGQYPYQVRVRPLGCVLTLDEAKKQLSRFNVKRNTPLFGQRLTDLLSLFISTPKRLSSTTKPQLETTCEVLQKQMAKIRNTKANVDIEEEIPIIESTTLWDFPRQSYGLTPKGDNKYAGVTPALIIYNLVWRYTAPGDLVVDPMCGSGTTIDVCEAEKRRVIGYDISPTRPDIIQNDARRIPLDDNSVDMVFVDSPYGDNITYSQHPDDIGHVSSESEEFYDKLERVMEQSHRILKEGKVLGWLIGDQWVRKKFTPVGFRIYERLCKYFEPVEIVCVTRRGQHSNTVVWHNRARRFNFYLRGFKYLIIVRKASGLGKSSGSRKIAWARYER
jgi:SAM-dependent methyltransferase